MGEFYTEIKGAHVWLVMLSGALFALRGLLHFLHAPGRLQRGLRWLSYGIDTGLLTAALMLATMLHMDPFTHHWLGLKILLLLVYIVLGSLALKRARGRRAQWVCFVAALAVYAIMFGIARAHHPWGWLRWYGWV